MSTTAMRSSPVAATGAFARFGELLDELGLERRDAASADAFSLVETGEGLELRPPGEADRRGIRAEFPPPGARPGAARPPLARAFGKRVVRIFDLTAGLGADAYRLAACGYRVEACERDPVVFALLVSGWQRACELGRVPGSVAERLRFRCAEGLEVLEETVVGGAGVYLDPMYPPPRRASALPKRALQVLRALLGGDASVEQLLEVARARSPRVVVKRPRHAPPVATGVDHEVVTKLVRYDVYIDPARLEARSS